MDWTQYWFMFPVAIGVATFSMLSGVGGAALFIPVFVIFFPMLGPDYPLEAAAAIGAALLTAVFGFSSGLVGYHRRGLIDFRSAVPFLSISVPVGVLGATLFGALQNQGVLLTGAYATLMLVLCVVMLRRTPGPAPMPAIDGRDMPGENGDFRTISARNGTTYRFRKPRQGPLGMFYTGLGSFLTGLLGVGVGEVILPQLVKRNRVPLAVAAATSVLIVVMTIAAASFTQIGLLIDAGGLDAVPWNLMCYTVPGVLIGGQLGPLLQGRIAQRTLERTIAILFGAIGVAMGWIALRSVP